MKRAPGLDSDTDSNSCIRAESTRPRCGIGWGVVLVGSWRGQSCYVTAVVATLQILQYGNCLGIDSWATERWTGHSMVRFSSASAVGLRRWKHRLVRYRAMDGPFKGQVLEHQCCRVAEVEVPQGIIAPTSRLDSLLRTSPVAKSLA